jgi:hypothetical protein
MKKNINKEKYKKVGTTVGGLLLILILLLFGISYAWYSFTNPDIDVSGTTSSWCSGLDVKVTEGSTISNYLGNAPVSNYSEAGYSSSFTITNNESSEVKVDLSLIDINIDKELISNDFRYTIVKDSTVISEGNFSQVKSGSGSSLTLASEITIPKNSTNTYSLVLWIYETGSTQSEMMNKSLSGKIKVSISSSFCSGSTGNLGSLYLAIKNQAVADNVASTYVTSSSGISFSSISSDTNGKGVYMLSSTASDTYPIYYYRGAVTNNNVIFGGFCWKIVRTTETGGVKIIYNGTPTSDNQCTNTTGTSTQIGESAFNSSYSSNAYVGYMYGTPGSSTYEEEHANTNNSTIKTTIDNWYKSNLTSYTSKLEDTVWCNDRSIDTTIGTGLGYGTKETYYMAHNRLYTNKTPSLSCTNANDRFTVSTANGNGKLTYPVDLLTADEIAYAGAVYYTANSTYYLYTGQYWWSLSPAYFPSSYATEWRVGSSGGLSYDLVDYSFGVRPAVSLIPGTKFVTGGEGTSTNPYIVK